MGVGQSFPFSICLGTDEQHHGESWVQGTSSLLRSSKRGANPFEEVLDHPMIKSKSARLSRKSPMKLEVGLISLIVCLPSSC